VHIKMIFTLYSCAGYISTVAVCAGRPLREREWRELFDRRRCVKHA